VALFKAGVSILNETIRNSSMILINASISIQNAAQQAMSSFTNCLSSRSSSSSSGSSGSIISSLFLIIDPIVSAPICAAKVTTQLIPAFVTTASTQIQSAMQILNQLLSPSSLNSSIRTLPQVAGLGANLTLRFAAKIATILQQAMQCMTQGFSSAITGFNG